MVEVIEVGPGNEVEQIGKGTIAVYNTFCEFYKRVMSAEEEDFAKKFFSKYPMEIIGSFVTISCMQGSVKQAIDQMARDASTLVKFAMAKPLLDSINKAMKEKTGWDNDLLMEFSQSMPGGDLKDLAHLAFAFQKKVIDIIVMDDDAANPNKLH